MSRSKLICCLLLMSCMAIGNLFSQEDLLLKNYRPVSIYHTPTMDVKKAAYPVIDMHSHDYAETAEELATWVKKRLG